MAAGDMGREFPNFRERAALSGHQLGEKIEPVYIIILLTIYLIIIHNLSVQIIKIS
ncbi:MAG: hypothetical protein K2M53_10325 [Muribaculaceae bacterium]|nr:hypothetical protein [Muribaculaceae bacterium]